MAEETHVLFAGKLPGKAALNRAMKELGFPVAVRPATGPLEGHSGYLPMVVRREESGVEFGVFDGRDAVEELAGKDADPRFTRSANFRWGGDENEMLAALCAAAALAKLVDGVVFDTMEDRLLSVDRAIAWARETLAAVAPPDDRREVPGTRPADIKRYLKPLLQQRDDLVLVGRRLFIRPVRHLMRGALLDRTSDKYLFRTYRSILPLYHSPQEIGFGEDLRAPMYVWQPHFEGLLMAMLAEDVFDEVGQITTFADFAEYLLKQPSTFDAYSNRIAAITALTLAGERDRAAACVEQSRSDFSRASYSETEKHWEGISRDIGALCTRFHAWEAEFVKALKLEHVWEPAPFPVELPPAERNKVSEPVFSPNPWIADPPSPLRAPPEHPGEVRFAKQVMRRDSGIVLVAPLTPAEAEERHREIESYALIARLADASLITIYRHGRWDRHEPPDSAPSRRPSAPRFYLIKLHGTSQIAVMDGSPHEEQTGLIEVWSVHVYERTRPDSTWQCHLRFKDRELSVHDSRHGPNVHTTSVLSPVQRDAALWPSPAFGEYVDVNERVRHLLRAVGFGEIA